MTKQDRQETENNLILIHQSLSMLEDLEADDVISAKVDVIDNAEYEEELGGKKTISREPTEQTTIITIRRRIGRDWIYSRLHEVSAYGRQLRVELTKVDREKKTLEAWIDGTKE